MAIKYPRYISKRLKLGYLIIHFFMLTLENTGTGNIF